KETRLKEEAKRQAVELKNSAARSNIQETAFTAIFTFIETENLPIATVPPKPQQAIKTYRVVGVKDGDTIEAIDDSTKKNIVIRLAHVDCPERPQAFGKRAKQFTSDLVFGKQIILQKTGVDRYKRWVCVVTCEGKNLNLELVKAGLAWHFKKYSKAQEYAEAESAARAAKKGLWRDPSPITPWDFRKKRH
ncbi:MAG: thermonuclease family protein, partial [Bacteroidota bacterium]